MSNPNETVESVNPLAVRQAGTVAAPGAPRTLTPAAKLAVTEDMGLEGDFTTNDIKLNRLNFVQSVGPLSVEHAPGTLLYAREVVLGLASAKEASKGLQITVLKQRKAYEEVVDYEENETARRVEKEEEVYALGGTLRGSVTKDANGKEVKVKATWRPTMQILLVIRQPDGVESDLFSHKIESDDENTFHPWEHGNYAVAILGAKSTSYGITKDLTAAAFRLAKGSQPLAYQRWELTVKREQAGDKWVFIPRLRTNGIHSDAFVRSMLGDYKSLPI